MTLLFLMDLQQGDSLVVFELPFGSFVTTQPTADISVSVDSSDLADLNEPLNITTQGGFVFGDSQTGTPGTDTILGSVTSDSVQPQLVTLQKNYLGSRRRDGNWSKLQAAIRSRS